MHRTTVVNLKGHRDDPDYADVLYVGRAMHRGGWHLDASPLASPYRPGPDSTREEVLAACRGVTHGPHPGPSALCPPRRSGRRPCRHTSGDVQFLVPERSLP